MDLGLTTRAAEAAYIAQQLTLAVPAALIQHVVRTVLGEAVDPGDEAIATIRRRFAGLLAQDLENVREGMYPRELLFQVPVASYAREAPRLLFELPRVALRRRREGWRELPRRVDTKDYPPYFRRTFHWQTDGYLSRRSAQLYDVGVELLFGGTADVMRRMVIPPITRYLREIGRADGRGVRVLDVACGTGRSLAQLHAAHPSVRLAGLDLSPFYVQEARERLEHVPDVSLVAENAEGMPWKDGWFDAVTSTYLFHELPRNARRNVMREMLRVLAPGGLVVIEDSAQPFESPELAVFLQRFPMDFHEPFYRDYLADDLAVALREVGFEVPEVRAHFMSKVVTARKPAD
ncbi:MAG: class I SAM-dependent methyltransferase [Myxococcota bacterium]|nr:class I SAM-dependent methyltransferase [Myxococcota bacterium]